MTRRRQVIAGVVGGAAAVLLAGRVLSGLYVDYQWYAQMHAVSVWESHLINRVLLTGAIAVAAMVFVFLNLYAVRRSIISIVLPRRLGNVEIGEELPSRYLNAFAVVGAIVLGVVLALPPEPWTELAAARYGMPFGSTDPYFQLDLGFYVYWLPLENALYVRALLVLVGTVVVVLVLYVAVTPSLRWDRTRFRVTAHVRRHLAALTPLFFGVLAWNYWLDAYAVLARGAGPAGLFTYADHQFVIPADRSLTLLLLAAGLVAGFALWRDQMRTALVVVTASLVALATYHFAIPLIEHSSSGPSTAAREQAYAIVRRQATRVAYGMDRLVTVPPADAPIRFASIAEAIPHISIWDPAALVTAMPRTRRQSLVAETVGWRWSPAGLLAWGVEYGGQAAANGDGGLFAPLMSTLLPVRATTVEDRGAPARTDFAGRPNTDEVLIPPVLVYAGAMGPLIVSDSLDHVVAPRIDGFLSRLAQAWTAQRLSWLAIDLPEPRPKVVDHRDVLERIRAVAPFFTPGATIWPVLSADSLYWAVDLYAAADMYPLSAHFQVDGDDHSYFQHAATAFVQAHTGRVVLAADSVRDPMADTWFRAFPEIFTAWSSLPPELATLTPPPVEGGVAMAEAFASVGARLSDRTGPIVQQQAALVDNADSLAASGEPACVAASNADEACTIAIPLMDASDRITGFVVAVGGTHHALVWVPVDSTAPRWTSALARLRQASDSLVAGRRDASVARGRVRAAVIDDHLMLAQPLYAWHPDAPPSLLGITAVLGDSAFAGPTLADAVGGDTTKSVQIGAASGGSGAPAFRAQVTVLYDSMQSALRRGDLAAFGQAYGQLGRLLGHAPDPHLSGRR